MVYERSKISSKKEKRVKLGLRLCSLHEEYKTNLYKDIGISQIRIDGTGCNFIKFDGSQCCNPTSWKTETTLFVPALKSSILFSEQKNKFFFKYHNINARQFENFVRFYILFLQHANETVNRNITENELIKIELNAAYFFEKMDDYFKSEKNETPFKDRISKLIKLDIFSHRFYARVVDNYIDQINLNDNIKAYVILMIIFKLMINEDHDYEKFLKKNIIFSFKHLKAIFEALFCPIKNVTTERRRIHALLENVVDKKTRFIILKSLSENASIDNICWH